MRRLLSSLVFVLGTVVLQAQPEPPHPQPPPPPQPEQPLPPMPEQPIPDQPQPEQPQPEQPPETQPKYQPAPRLDTASLLELRIQQLQGEVRQILQNIEELSLELVRVRQQANPMYARPERLQQAGEAYAAGRLAEQQKDYRQALMQFTTAVQLDPENDSAFLHRAAALLAMGENEQALSDLDKAIKLQPNSARAYQLHGQASFAVGRFERALLDYDQAAVRDSQNSEIFVQRAEAHRKLGRIGRALGDCQSALDVNPDFPPGLLCRAMAFIAVRREAAALPDLERVLELTPQNVEAKTLLAHVQATLLALSGSKAPVLVTVNGKPHGAPPPREAGNVIGRAESLAKEAESSALVPVIVEGSGRVPRPGEVGNVFSNLQSQPSALPQPAPVIVDSSSPEPSDPPTTEPVSPTTEANRIVTRSAVPGPAVAAESKQQAYALVVHARTRGDRGDFRGAIQELDEAIRMDPTSAVAYNSRGYAHLRLREYPSAISDFTEAIRIQGRYPNAEINLFIAKRMSAQGGGGTEGGGLP